MEQRLLHTISYGISETGLYRNVFDSEFLKCLLIKQAFMKMHFTLEKIIATKIALAASLLNFLNCCTQKRSNSEEKKL